MLEKNGRSPLHYACQDGHREIVKYLLQKECKADRADERGITPSRLAIVNGNMAIAHILTQGGGGDEDEDLNVSFLSYFNSYLFFFCSCLKVFPTCHQ